MGRLMRFGPAEVEVNEACANRLEAIEPPAARPLGLSRGTAPTRSGSAG